MSPGEANVRRCGRVVLAGEPNAGKSTLLNALVGAPLAIVSGKPQSTRLPIVGLRTEGDTQLILVDPPGLLDPTYALQHGMVRAALDALRQADAVLHLHRATDLPAPDLGALVARYPDPPPLPGPRLLVLTQADRIAPGRRPTEDPAMLVISAVTGEGLDGLLTWCRNAVPRAPFRFEADDLSTQPERFFAAEYVREAAFDTLEDEVPYAINAEVDEFREHSTPVYIRITIHVERESQRRIVIGRGGQTIRALGMRARPRIEALLGRPVFLDLWVKTLPKWRSSPQTLRRLGFTLPGKERA